MQVIVDGLLTHYERSGTGPTILLIPGWADTSKGWAHFQKSLSANFDVIVIDLPGFGGSLASSTAWGLDEYADFLQNFLQKIGAENIYAAIGHSNGGAMAMRAIHTSVLKPKKLVLIASAGVRSKGGGRKNALKLFAKAGKAATILLPSSTRAKLRQKLYSAVGSDMLVAEGMQETFKKVVADDVRDDAASISVPSILIYGDQDAETPVDYGRQFSDLIKGSKLTILPGIGHFPHIDAPEQTIELVRSFLK